MGVKLTIEVEGPLSPDDRKMMTGVGMTIIAVAAGDEEEGGEGGQDPAEEDSEFPLPEMQQVAHQMHAAGQLHEVPEACRKPDPADNGKVCAGDVGHRGRHLYRFMSARAN